MRWFFCVVGLAGCDIAFPVELPDPCPDFTTELPSQTSRYKILLDMAPIAAHRAACEGSSPNAHLVAFETEEEIAALDQVLEDVLENDPEAPFDYYVGIHQLPDQMLMDDGWKLDVPGERDLPLDLWVSGEPNDGADGVEDNDENLAYLDPARSGGFLQDTDNKNDRGAVCECEP